MASIITLDETFYEASNRRLSNISQLRLMNVLQDLSDNVKFLNIFRSYSLNESATADIVFYDLYSVDNDDWWDNISYKFYGNPNLWWLVAIMNNTVNPFEELEEGTEIKILRKQYLYTVLSDMENISDL
uniref:Putative baseplate n=1 Tax=viral metagenome TaxID=1070528 RepID=A0A6M3K7I7_9ZZZZ